MSIMLNSYFRAFIQESPNSEYQYSEDAVQVAGISETFGDITYIYGASDIHSNDYKIIAQVRGADTAPTTTITAYLPENGYSQLLRLAKKRCTFNMHLHAGICNNPTDFNDFDYGLVFKNVRITGYSTTDLVSRSPDSRSAVDLTFNVSMEDVLEIRKSDFKVIANNTTGGILTTYGYNDVDCTGGANCSDSCEVLSVQLRTGNSFRFLRTFNGEWYNSAIVSGISPSTTSYPIIYTNGTTIYTMLNFASPSTYGIYSLDYSDMDNTSAVFTTVKTGTGSVANNYYVYGGKLYFGLRNSTSSALMVLNVGTGVVSTIQSVTSAVRSVFGNGSVVYFTTDGGNLYKYKNNTVLDLTTKLPVSGVGIGLLSIKGENVFSILTSTGSAYSTTNGGDTWTLLYSGSNIDYLIGYNYVNPEHQIVKVSSEDTLLETFDGGITFITNTTFDGLTPTSVSYCEDQIYVGLTDATKLVGAIYEHII